MRKPTFCLLGQQQKPTAFGMQKEDKITFQNKVIFKKAVSKFRCKESSFFIQQLIETLFNPSFHK